MDDYFAHIPMKPWRHHELLSLNCANQVNPRLVVKMIGVSERPPDRPYAPLKEPRLSA